MFDLNQAIRGWRQELAAGGIERSDVLDELESHLRDDIEQQLSGGADAREAFDSAVRRLGPAPILRREFARSAARLDSRRRRFLRASCFTCAAFVLLVNTWTLIVYDLGPGERATGLSLVILASAYLAALPFLGRLLSANICRRILTVAKISALAAPPLAILAALNACRLVPFELGLVPSLLLWLFYAVLTITAVACGLGGKPGYGGDSGGLPVSSGPQPIPPQGPHPLDFGITVPLEQFAPAARASLETARDEARRLGHNYIGTEHVLLGLLKRADASFAGVLEKSRVEPEAVRIEIEQWVRSAAFPKQPPGTTLPLTPRAQKALRLAGKEARTRRQPSVKLEHILVGLLLEGSGVAARVLKHLGVRTGRLREEICRASA